MQFTIGDTFYQLIIKRLCLTLHTHNFNLSLFYFINTTPNGAEHHKVIYLDKYHLHIGDGYC